MSLELPEDLLNLPANAGVFAIWMLFHHYAIDLNTADLAKLAQHDHEAGCCSIALAVAIEQLGLAVTFHTDPDPEPRAVEILAYRQAAERKIAIEPALSYAQLQELYQQGYFLIVYYDNADGVGHHSLVYAIDHEEISFFDCFEAMPATDFEHQRQVDGICRQVIVIDDRKFVMREQ